MGKRRVCGIVGLWLLAAATPGQVRGAEAAKRERDPAARWSDMQALVLRTPFENLRYPHLGKNGSVTFIADDTYSNLSKGENHGIFRYQADGSLVCLVRGGETTVPGGTATLEKIQGLQTDEDGVEFVFNAFDTDKQRGLYRWAGGKLETVVRTGETILPEDKGAVDSVEYGSLHGHHLLYKASSEYYGAALVLRDLTTGKEQVLCHAGMAIPDRPGDRFQNIASTNWVNGDSVVFCGGGPEDPPKENGKSTDGIYGWFGIKDWSGAGGDFAPGRLRKIVDGNSPMPLDDASRKVNFDVFGSAPTSGNNTTFQASNGKVSGIFTARTPDGPVRCIVYSGTEFDGPFKGRFISFGGYPAVSGQNVIFTAVAEEGKAKGAADTEDDDDGAADAKKGHPPKQYRGVFVYRLDRDELFTLTDDLEPLDQKQVAYYEIGGHFLVDDHFAVTVHFKDKSCQIYLGTIKPEAFRRLTGAAASAKPEPTP